MKTREQYPGLARTRATEVLALLLAGDGLVAMVQPRRHMLLWREGPDAWRRMSDVFVERPLLTRLVGAAELAAGIWLASRQRR